MKRILCAAAILVAFGLQAHDATAGQPYVQIETGIVSRDIVEEDASIQGFTFGGTAESTRVLARVGFNFNDFVSMYALGGGADLSIDEFNGFDSSLSGAFGGGVRFDMRVSPYRGGLRLFVEGSMLHTSADDTVQADFGCTAANGCTAAAQGAFVPRLAQETIEWNEYTVLLGAAARYRAYGPYGGVRLSWVDATDKVRAPADENFSTEFRADADLKEQDNFGIFLGTDFYLDRSGKTALNLEFSLFDQESFRVAVRRSF